ncbi:MAG: hypothetical protein NXI20_07450 [bacterium]|nr:hypothetical protein [bacterium]
MTTYIEVGRPETEVRSWKMEGRRLKLEVRRSEAEVRRPSFLDFCASKSGI